MEEAVVGVACGKRVLQSYVPHAEEATWKEREHHYNHRAFGVVGIVDVYS